MLSVVPLRRLRALFAFAGDGISHPCVGLDVLHGVVIHDSEIPFTECLSHRFRHFRLGLHNFGPHLSHSGGHLLFLRNGHGAARFGSRLGDPKIGLGLIGLKMRPDVLAHIHIGNIDTENLKRRAGVQPFLL